jgi:CHAT domain-containing protein
VDPAGPDPADAITAEHARSRKAHRERQLEAARDAGDLAGIATQLFHLSQIHIELGEFEEALHVASESLDVAGTAGDPSIEALALQGRGDAFYYLGAFARARRDFEAAGRIAREQGDHFGHAAALKSTGIVDKELGEFDQALGELEGALEIFRTLDHPDQVASTLGNLGGLYEQLGDDRRSLEYFQEALAIGRLSGLGEILRDPLLHIGSLHLERGDPERALEALREGHEISRRLGQPNSEQWSLGLISYALARLDRVDEAIEVQKEALSLSRQIGSELLVANRLIALGGLYLDREPAAALDLTLQGLQTYERFRFRDTWHAHAQAARARHRLGDLDGAIESYGRAVEGLESQRVRILADQLRATFFTRYQDIYREFVGVLIERGARGENSTDVERAFEVTERARARRLVEAITEARLDLGSELPADLQRREEQLTALVAKLQRELVRPRLRAEERERILDGLERADAEFTRLVGEIRRRNPPYAAILHPEPISAAGARALLGPQTALLAYFRTATRLVVFLVTRPGVQAFELPADPGLVEERVATYLDLISDDRRDGWEPVSRRLEVELLAPVRAVLPEPIDTLVIVPDGALHFLPFETLLRSSGTDAMGSRGRFLLEDHIVSYAPSGTALRELTRSRDRRPPRDRADLVMFASPEPLSLAQAPGAAADGAAHTRALYEDEGIEIPPIPYSADEAEAIRDLASRRSQIYLGDQATEGRVKITRLDDYRVIHFATHGLISQRWPARSALLLSDGGDPSEDGFLQAREIYRLRLASDLVVLSACRTARGQILAGEGVQGLAQAFFHAGARSVVASLWDVDDYRTATLMRAFYTHLGRKLPAADALRRAKLDLIGQPSTAAPRLWAPFVLTGAGDLPIPLTRTPWWQRVEAWLAIGIGTIGGTVLWNHLRRDGSLLGAFVVRPSRWPGRRRG